ncbi:hypothetical protein VXJ28_07195 [Enterococcus faecium]
MEDLMIPGHLLEKIDVKHLEQFIKNEGLVLDGNKAMLIDSLIKIINEESDKYEKKQLIASYHNFLLKTIKHINNRIVVTYPIITTEQSVYFSERNIIEKFDVNSIDDLNFSDVLLGKNLKKEKFTKIFRHVSHTNGLIDLIEICYGRINSYKREDETEKEIFEYVWCEINPLDDVVRIILSENPQAFIKDNSNESRNKIQTEIIGKLKRDYNLTFKLLNEKQTLFKIYKYLTAHLEEPYAQKLEPYQEEIQRFVTTMLNNLNTEEARNIRLSHRVRKLFERNLIQKDFQKFITKKVDDGRVLSIIYSDAVGGNVKATSGGTNARKDLDLQDSDVYFDTKESIYFDQELSSIVVSWVNKSELKDDRFDNIEVRYTCYREFYITHFLRYNVREEIYEYVLPKFDEYKRKPL